MPTWCQEIVLDGVDCLLLLPDINWRQRPRVTHIFETDTADGRTGIEARASTHHEVRLAVEYMYSFAHAVADEVIETLLALDHDVRIALPLWPDKKLAADYLAQRMWAPQHWLNINTATGAFTVDADGGHPESVGLIVCALLDDPRKVAKTDQHSDLVLRAEEDSPWESRTEVNTLALATWDFEANWIQLPEESSRRLLQRRRIGQGRMTARTGQDAPAKRTQAGRFTFDGDQAVRKALTFWCEKRGPHAAFTVKRFLRPGWDGTPGTEPIMQACFADETLSLEFSAPGVAHARIAFEQDLVLGLGHPSQARPSRAFLYKVWWENGVTVRAWTDWAKSYTHGGIEYLPNIVEHKASNESLRPGHTDWELLVYDHDGNPLRAFGRLQRERRLLVQIRECDPAIADTATLVFDGEITAAPNKGRIFTARAALFGGAMRSLVPQHFCQQGCNNVWGDDLCGVNMELHRVDGVIAAINDTVVDVTCGSAAAVDYFALGFAQFGAGDDLELRYVLRSEPIAGGQRLTLHRPLWVSIVGSDVDLYPGCDQQYDGGCARYGNQGSFFGAPHKPVYIDTVSSGFKAKVGK